MGQIFCISLQKYTCPRVRTLLMYDRNNILKVSYSCLLWLCDWVILPLTFICPFVVSISSQGYACNAGPLFLVPCLLASIVSCFLWFWCVSGVFQLQVCHRFWKFPNKHSACYRKLLLVPMCHTPFTDSQQTYTKGLEKPLYSSRALIKFKAVLSLEESGNSNYQGQSSQKLGAESTLFESLLARVGFHQAVCGLLMTHITGGEETYSSQLRQR